METNEMSVESLNQLAEITSLKHRNYELQREIEDQRNYITFLEDKIEQLSEKPKKEVKYKVVRSYQRGSCQIEDLKDALSDGWVVVRASEFIPELEINGSRYYGFIEYILEKEVEVEQNDNR